MRILFVTSKSFGGAGKYISVLTDGMGGAIDCEIIYYPSGVSQDVEVEKHFFRVHHFSSKPCFNPVSLIKNILQVRRLLLSGGYTAMHSHTSLGGLVGRVGAFLTRRQIAVIHTLHAYGADEFTPALQKWFYWLIEKVLDQMTDIYISPSRHMVEYGGRIRLIDSRKARVIYNSLPLEEPGPKKSVQREQVREMLGVALDETVFLFCGRLEHQKGVDVLIQALARLPANAAFRLLICGDGNLRESLERLSHKLGMSDRLVWLGWQADVNPFYAASDIYVMPSRWESFGLVFLEAMNYKLPIISTRVQAVPEVVEDGVCGVLVSSESPVELAEAMWNMLSNPSRRIAYGEAGRAVLQKKFAFDKFIGEHLRVYRSLCKEEGE